MMYTGYIEGYYGRTLTWEQRHRLCDHLHTLSLTTYLYAPKEDPYHRLQWKKAYPRSWRKQFSQFVTYAHKKRITVIPACAPGLTFDYTSTADYKLLLKKFYQFLSMGATTFALLMDDISEQLPRSSEGVYRSLGQAHGKLLTKLHNDLEKTVPCTLWFCPTIYCDDFGAGNGASTPYMQDLAATIPDSIPILWTGPSVVSEKITTHHMRNIRRLFNNNVIIWDNYYANDYCPMRLFVGTYDGRSANLDAQVRGLLLNPTGLFHTDLFLLSLFAHFLTTKKNSLKQWETIARTHNIPEQFFKIRHLFWSPFNTMNQKIFSKNTLTTYGDIFNDVLLHWQSPLKQEWYPFIYGVHLDKQIIEKEDKITHPQWITMRYPPYIAEWIKDLCK